MWIEYQKRTGNSFRHILKCRHHIPILLALTVLTYFRTVDVPFYFDDFGFVVNNPLIRDLDNYFNKIPVPVNILEDVFTNFKLRPLSYLSFSMNYLVHGSSPAGYHVVNIAIHALNSILVYVAVISIFALNMAKPGVPDGSIEANRGKSVAFFTAALFVAHPIMTNAVTYVTQRMASLATLFYLATVVMYAGYQLREASGKGRTMWYLLALVFCCAAMLSKEIAITLPITLVVLDFLFCRAGTGQRLLRLAPFVATMGIIPYLAIGLGHSNTVQTGNKLQSVLNLVNFTGISSTDYFITQLKVIAFYLRLMVVPKGQSLDHHFPLSTSLIDPGIPASILLHTLLIGYAGYLLFRCGKHSSLQDIMRHVSGFGIVWFYLTLSIESSIIPLMEPAVEYRLYLPATGFLLFVVCTVYGVFDRYWPRTSPAPGFWILTMALVLYMGLTVARNEVWRVPETFWRQTISQYPFWARPYANLADSYLAQKRPEEAVMVYREAIARIPDLPVLHYELGNVYIQAGRYKEAVRELSQAISMAPDKREAYYSLAKAQCWLGEFGEALQTISEGEKATSRYYK